MIQSFKLSITSRFLATSWYLSSAWKTSSLNGFNMKTDIKNNVRDKNQKQTNLIQK